MRYFHAGEQAKKGSKRRPPEPPRPKVASLEEGENREHIRKDIAEPLGKILTEAKDEDGGRHPHPKEPLVTQLKKEPHRVVE